jgi:hypothetical protein
MKYWAYLLAKLGGAFAIFFGMMKLTSFVFRYLEVINPHNPFSYDLRYTLTVMFNFLALVGLGYLAVWDQRYRCRTCLRPLRMPVNEGGFHRVLFAPPKTGYICPFGHGTLRVPELKAVNHDPSDWQEHDDDIWKELFAVHESEK